MPKLPSTALKRANITTEDGRVMDLLAYDPVVVEARRLQTVDTLAVRGVINSSLYSALSNSVDGELPRSELRELAFSLADIFEYRVDMSRDLQRGDRFHILVERLQQPNGKIIINKILGARLALSGHDVEAVRFDSRGSSGNYFDESGRSLKASFLRTPVAFRRISSVFGARKHPIFGEWRAHKGTDYAAPAGTPVRSIGDGVVVFAGWKGGYGKVIDVRHRNGYVSRYGHLSGFAKGVRPGARVEMGKTIAYVGSTGWATGPHLHFEVLIQGIQRDPRAALAQRGGDPILSSERQLFDRTRAQLMATLRGAGLNDQFLQN